MITARYSRSCGQVPALFTALTLWLSPPRGIQCKWSPVELVLGGTHRDWLVSVKGVAEIFLITSIAKTCPYNKNSLVQCRLAVHVYVTDWLWLSLVLLTVPGYISRSVAGSYDNEGIAIFALQFTYFLWVGSNVYFYFRSLMAVNICNLHVSS